MKSSKIESKKNIGFSRILDKVLHTIAKSSLLGSKARVFIHHLRGVKFKNRSTVFIGEDVIIDPINPSNVEIGDRCLITAGAKILTHYIDTKNRSENPEYYFRFYDGKVIIEDDVFIGANAVIAKPVRIGKGSIIGANVVVTKDIKTSSACSCSTQWPAGISEFSGHIVHNSKDEFFEKRLVFASPRADFFAMTSSNARMSKKHELTKFIS